MIVVPGNHDDIGLAGVLDADLVGAAEPHIALVMNDADAAVPARQLIRNLAGPVGAPVVDDDDLVAVETLRRPADLPHGILDVLLFIERRHDETDPSCNSGSGRLRCRSGS